MWERLRSFATDSVEPERREAHAEDSSRSSAPTGTLGARTPNPRPEGLGNDSNFPERRPRPSQQQRQESRLGGSADTARNTSSKPRAAKGLKPTATLTRKQLPSSVAKPNGTDDRSDSERRTMNARNSVATSSAASIESDPHEVPESVPGAAAENRDSREAMIVPDHEPDSICVVCREPAQDWAIGPCDHRLCLRCAHRARALYGNRRCVVCNQELEEMIVVPAADTGAAFKRSVASTAHSIDSEKADLWDANAGLRYTDRTAWDQMCRLLIPTCAACGFTTTGVVDLVQHVRHKHPNHTLCEVCVGSGRKYWTELVLYPLRLRAPHTRPVHSSLERRASPGIADITLRDHLRSEHAACRFCKRHFYDDDDLYEHLTKTHESCMLCEREGIQYVYYRNFAALEEHYRTAHYVCEAPSCRGLVFATLLDLQVHYRRHCPESNGSSSTTAHLSSRTFRFQELQQEDPLTIADAASNMSFPRHLIASDEREMTARSRAHQRGFSGATVVYADASGASLPRGTRAMARETLETQSRGAVEDTAHPSRREESSRLGAPRPEQSSSMTAQATAGLPADQRTTSSRTTTSENQTVGEVQPLLNAQSRIEAGLTHSAVSRSVLDLGTATHTIPRSEAEAMRRGALLLERLKVLLRAESPHGQEAWALFRSHCERFLRREIDADACVHALGHLLMESGTTASTTVDILFEMSVLQPDAEQRQYLLAATKKYAASMGESNQFPGIEPSRSPWTLSNVVRNSSARLLPADARARTRAMLAPEAFPSLSRTLSTEPSSRPSSSAAAAGPEAAGAKPSATAETSPGSVSTLEESFPMMRLRDPASAVEQRQQDARLSTSNRGTPTTRFDGGALFEPGRGGRVLDVVQLARERQAQRLQRGVLIGHYGFAWEQERDLRRRLAAKTQQRSMAAEHAVQPSAK